MSERQVFQNGSKSFSLAARFFPKEIQRDVESLYAWCRHCDDRMDTPRPGMSVQEAFIEISRLTTFALNTPSDSAGSLPLPYSSLARVQKKHGIAEESFREFLLGMKMDARPGLRIKNTLELLSYCYRVAGVVGLMMTSILGIRSKRANTHAVSLGIGMQMTNIARDVKEDFERDRIYLPEEWLTELRLEPERLMETSNRERLFQAVRKILTLADEHYRNGLEGLGYLSPRSAITIAVAASLYRGIGEKILRMGPTALQSRVSTTTIEKSYLVARGLVWAAQGFMRALRKRIQGESKSDPQGSSPASRRNT